MRKVTLVVMVAVLLLCGTQLTVLEAVTPAVDCSNKVSLLLPCLSFISGQEPTPPQLCCDTLKSMVVVEASCLCELLGYGSSNLTLPSTANSTLLTELPALCSISADPAQCTALISGAPSPTPSSSSQLSSAERSGRISGAPTSNHGVSREFGSKAFSIVRFAAAPAVASLLLRVYY